MSGDAGPRHYTIIVGQFTLNKLSAREAVTVQQEDGGSVTLLDASDYPRAVPVSGDDRDAALARIARLEAALHHSLSGAKLANALGRILERHAGGKPHFSGYNELCRALAEYRASAAALADAPGETT